MFLLKPTLKHLSSPFKAIVIFLRIFHLLKEQNETVPSQNVFSPIGRVNALNTKVAKDTLINGCNIKKKDQKRLR